MKELGGAFVGYGGRKLALVLAMAAVLICVLATQAQGQTPSQVQYGGGEASEVLNGPVDPGTDPGDPGDPSGATNGTGAAATGFLPSTGGSLLFLGGLAGLALVGTGALVFVRVNTR